jgi:hypothetical protein
MIAYVPEKVNTFISKKKTRIDEKRLSKIDFFVEFDSTYPETPNARPE